MRSRRGLPTRNRPRFPRFHRSHNCHGMRFVGEPCCQTLQDRSTTQANQIIAKLQLGARPSCTSEERNTSARPYVPRGHPGRWANRVFGRHQATACAHAVYRGANVAIEGSKSPAAPRNRRAAPAHQAETTSRPPSHTPVSLSLRCVITSENRSNWVSTMLNLSTQHCEPTLRLFRRRRIADWDAAVVPIPLSYLILHLLPFIPFLTM